MLFAKLTKSITPRKLLFFNRTNTKNNISEKLII